jgi:cell division protein FtsB
MSRGRVVFLACLLAASYFTYTAGVGAFRTHQLGAQEQQAARDLAALRDTKAYLEAVRNYVASDAFVEQEARRRLGYIREGEVPIIVLSPQLPQEDRQAGDWWQRLFPR